MIKAEFQAYYQQESLEVDLRFVSSADACNPDVIATEFRNNEIDILEIDTIILGEVADKEVLLPIDNVYPDYKVDDFFPVAVQSSRYRDNLYGIPTLVCGNFFIEYAKSATATPYLPTEVVDSMSYMENLLCKISGPHSDRSAVLHSNFRGSWTLPLLYMQWFVVQNPHRDIGNAYFPFQPIEETLNSLRKFMNLGLDRDGYNKALSEYYKTNPTELITDMATSDHSLFNGYTEISGQVVKQSKRSQQTGLNIINAAAYSRHITFTDAVVVNRAHGVSRDARKMVAVN